MMGATSSFPEDPLHWTHLVPVDDDDYTVAYDLYMQDALETAGVTGALQVPTGPSRENLFLHTLTNSGAVGTLLAGLVRDSAGPWRASLVDPEGLEAVRDPKGRAFLLQALEQGLPAFFARRTDILGDFPTICRLSAGRLREKKSPEVRGQRQFGQWDGMIRVLAGYNPADFSRVLDWHLRDALLAYEHAVRQLALAEYRHREVAYLLTAPYAKKGTLKQPKLPRILKG